MTNQQINAAIADACGFDVKPCPIHGGIECCGRKRIPNYCSDLNAMHEAEMTLHTTYIGTYYDNLVRVANTRICAFMASARDRAETFVKTIGKWVE